MPYLTPDELPDDTICRVLVIPNERQFIGCVTGALEELTFVHNWELFGDVTPVQAARAMRSMFDNFCFGIGECRVIGEIIPYAGSTSPTSNWLVCDGSSLLRADYPELFTVIGTTYGAVDGSHFNIPDTRGRAAIGAGQGTGLTSRSLGATVGTEQHSLTVGEMPAHSHADAGHAHTLPDGPAGLVAPGVIPVSVVALAGTGLASAVIQNTGGNGAHNNMQPSLAINYLIVAKK